MTDLKDALSARQALDSLQQGIASKPSQNTQPLLFASGQHQLQPHKSFRINPNWIQCTIEILARFSSFFSF